VTATIWMMPSSRSRWTAGARRLGEPDLLGDRPVAATAVALELSMMARWPRRGGLRPTEVGGLVADAWSLSWGAVMWWFRSVFGAVIWHSSDR